MWSLLVNNDVHKDMIKVLPVQRNRSRIFPRAVLASAVMEIQMLDIRKADALKSWR